MVHMCDFLRRRLTNGWSDSSLENRLEISAAGYQGSLGFDRCQTPEMLHLREGLLRVSLIILRSGLFKSER